MAIDGNNWPYDYEKLTLNISELARRFTGWLSYESMGRTPFGREIWLLRLGQGPVPILLNGAHHGREWLTSLLLMRMLEAYALAAEQKGRVDGISVRPLLEQVSFWVVPMVNPDGVTLQQYGLDSFPWKVHSQLLAFNDGLSDFTRWKANGVGIDLNRQYPAHWEQIQDDVGHPWYKQYKGERPLEAEEAKLMVQLTASLHPTLAVAYHSAGQVLYWYFYNHVDQLARDCRLANQMAVRSGYVLMQPEVAPNGGGFTDWFIQTFNRPGFTPELGAYPGETHLPLADLKEELKIHIPLGLWLAREMLQLE